MSVYFIKSLLSVLATILAVIAMFTMFEVFGRSERKYDVKKLMQIHRLTGRIYIVIFVIVTYYCLDLIASSKTELSSRGAVHSTLAISIAVIIGLKYLFIKVYRGFYGYIKIMGTLMVIFTFLMAGLSGGYYMLVSKLGTTRAFDKISHYGQASNRERENRQSSISSISIQTDLESIARGENLFNSKCIFCHTPNSDTNKVGPGLKGILKNDFLPVSGLPANPVNVANQLKKPFSRMPSFEYLPDDDIADIIAYLNSL